MKRVEFKEKSPAELSPEMVELVERKIGLASGGTLAEIGQYVAQRASSLWAEPESGDSADDMRRKEATRKAQGGLVSKLVVRYLEKTYGEGVKDPSTGTVRGYGDAVVIERGHLIRKF